MHLLRFRIPGFSDALGYSLILCSLWLNIEVTLGGGLILPGVVALLTGAILSLLLMPAWLGKETVAAVFLMLTISVLCLCSLLVRSGAGDLVEGAAQMLSSIVIATSLLLWLRRRDPASVATFLYVIVCIALTIATLEVFLPEVQSITEIVRRVIYGDRSLYDAVERDILVYGLPRPMALTKEPSLLGFFISVGLTAWVGVSSWRYRYLLAFALLAYALWLVRTPVAVLGFVGVTAVLFYEGIISKRMRILHMCALLLVLTVFAGAVAQIFATRIEFIAAGTDLSAAARITASPFVTVASLRDSPVFGFGPGSRDAMLPYVWDVLAGFGFSDRLAGMQTEVIGDYVTNYLWLHWIYFGVLGGVIVLFQLVLYGRAFGCQHPWVAIALFFLFGQAHGAYVSVRVWVVFALLVWTTGAIDARWRTTASGNVDRQNLSSGPGSGAQHNIGSRPLNPII